MTQTSSRTGYVKVAFRLPITHVAHLRDYSFTCALVASHLNHDGRPNGITRVMRADGRLTDVGVVTLADLNS